MALLDVFRKKEQKKVMKRAHFQGITPSRWNDFRYSLARLNQDLRQEWDRVVERCRDLAQNDPWAVGCVNSFTRNVVGADGFVLQCAAADPRLRSFIEGEWHKYLSRGAGLVSVSGGISGRQLDKLILRTLLTDGEVFIRRVIDRSSPYLVRYEVLDSLDIDPWYNVQRTEDGGRITMGIRFDAAGRETAYFLRLHNTEFYRTGERIEIPASEVIHIFERRQADQARGIPIFAAVISDLPQLNSYKEAELVRARMQACTMGIWERNGQALGDLLDETNDQGEFTREISPGTFQVAPEGYTAKFLQGTAPNANFGGFWKSVLRGAANALGLSYNKSSGDYEAVNFSSLREATLEDRAQFEDLQRFLIEEWKDLQYADFIRALFINGRINSAQVAEAERHRFFGRRFPWMDPVKEINALEREFAWHLTDPLTELERRGKDPVEELDRWARWNALCKERGLSAEPSTQTVMVTAPAEEEVTEGEQNGE